MERVRILNKGFFRLVVVSAVLFFFAAPAHAGIVDVLFGGTARIYFDTNNNNQLDPDQDGYYSAIYDEEQFILLVFGNNGLIPNPPNAFIYKLSGVPEGDITITELPEATVDGVEYKNLNTEAGLPPLRVTFGKRNDRQTYNWGKSSLGDEPEWADFILEGLLEDMDGDPDGVFDALRVAPYQGAPEQVLDVQGPDHREDIDNKLYYSFWWGIPDPAGFLGVRWYKVFLPVDANEAITVTTANETLLGVPRKPATWVDPPFPGYMNMDPDDPADPESSGGGKRSDNETDPWQRLLEGDCFIKSVNNQGAIYALHVQAARHFKSSALYPAAGIALCLLVLFSGIWIMRKRNFGQDL